MRTLPTLAFLLLSIGACALGQTSSNTITICKGITIPDGYTIVAETTSPDCDKGAYLVKKATVESKPTEGSAKPSDSKAEDKTTTADGLYKVQKIFVGDMGKSDDSERFRMLLTEDLAKKKFTIVDQREKADAVLTGVLSTQLSRGTTRARVSVQLKSTDGSSLWSGDFGVHFALGFHRDSIKMRAEDVADGLRDDWKKSAKKAGVPESK
jgi:hypothetical protein